MKNQFNPLQKIYESIDRYGQGTAPFLCRHDGTEKQIIPAYAPHAVNRSVGQHKFAWAISKAPKRLGIWSALKSANIAIGASSFVSLSACAAPLEVMPPQEPKAALGELAFPGALGHGAASKGGRGGRIIYVTTREDRGEGSLRACLTAKGPRVCVFRVGGIFRFTKRPPIVKNPFLTIAGQTAPGGGVVITHSGGSSARTPVVIKNTHDVIVRHVRVRIDKISGNRQSDDGFTIESSENVILDHVSASWAADELVSGYGDNDKITISNSIFAYGLPRHDKCALLGSDPKGPQKLSFIQNICAHNGDRNPDLNFEPGSCVEVVNNVMYNAQSQFAEVWETYGGTPVSIVGNTFAQGPNGHKGTQAISRAKIDSSGKARIYLWDNNFVGDLVSVSDTARERQVGMSPCPLTVTAKAPDAAYDHVLSNAGAWPRDDTDTKAITTIRNRSGRIISKPGTISVQASMAAFPDADQDGMDDLWEAENLADPGRADTWEDGNGDGVSNFEEFLASRELQFRSGRK